MEMTRNWEEGRMGSYYSMNAVTVWDNQKVLEMYSGNSCTAL